MKRHIKRVLLEGLGWLLVVVGIAALILPGPGLLAIFAGMALLATQYTWAEKRLEPIKAAALKTAAESVTSWARIAVSLLLCLALICLGIVWGLHPAVASWWPLADKWWLIGGWSTGGALIGSGVLAFAMIVYSFLHFRRHKA